MSYALRMTRRHRWATNEVWLPFDSLQERIETVTKKSDDVQLSSFENTKNKIMAVTSRHIVWAPACVKKRGEQP